MNGANVLMGMFDYFRCSSDIGELTDVECQTKDISNMMSFYWVDPSGHMWTVDYTGTQTIHINEEKKIFGRITYVPNGNKGKLYRVYFNGVVEVYRSKGDSSKTCCLQFVDGVLQSYAYK